MKRFLALLSALLVVLALSGCAPLLEAVLSAVESELTAAMQSPAATASPPAASQSPVQNPVGEAAVSPSTPTPPTPSLAPTPTPIDEDGTYDGKEDVALYLFTYGHLPGNYITKNEARSLGWDGGGLEAYAPGKCIGGDRFGNYEGLLPNAPGRSYTECDIGTLGKSGRGAQRIVFSNDGLVYYTDDHYESFELLYGEE